ATRTLFRSAPGALGVVEATGVGAAISLLAGSFRSTASAGDPLREGLDATSAAAVPRLTHRADGTSLDDEARAALAAGALRGMSLTRDFAPLVAFVGHGASVRNNPQAAGLACGACGGQSGELNARALAALLNDAGVRTRLVAQGIAIPDGTAFVGGVHDTVTEQVTLFPEPAVARTHAAELAAFGRALDAAGAPARRERATRLGRPGSSDPHAEAVRRASDWSEVRPEWALARNAAFICAPRARTRGLDLDGRTFLHEYRWQDDAGFATLEAILTAPVVVAHWINFQYYASTVDPERYGSGDKTLHNVVGGTLGVYEGAGGDLRIGLARQSVHDGQAFVHEPLRLGVYVEAPIEAIERVLARHAVVRQLVSHRWIFLHQLSPDDGRVRLWRPDGWVPMT
ncbi:MAG: DUF2309 family protein, partial [Gemmatimonadetes bacterium]|nr:DUF2309 family protein [Gemmatimonadota bacterium]